MVFKNAQLLALAMLMSLAVAIAARQQDVPVKTQGYDGKFRDDYYPKGDDYGRDSGYSSKPLGQCPQVSVHCPTIPCPVCQCKDIDPRLELCHGECLNTENNNNHCGGCDDPCPEDKPFCYNGDCITDTNCKDADAVCVPSDDCCKSGPGNVRRVCRKGNGENNSAEYRCRPDSANGPPSNNQNKKTIKGL